MVIKQFILIYENEWEYFYVLILIPFISGGEIVQDFVIIATAWNSRTDSLLDLRWR